MPPPGCGWDPFNLGESPEPFPLDLLPLLIHALLLLLLLPLDVLSVHIVLLQGLNDLGVAQFAVVDFFHDLRNTNLNLLTTHPISTLSPS